ncbi:MAG: TolC family protein [bacterium]|nr:TolC family protein [bacterium]
MKKFQLLFLLSMLFLVPGMAYALTLEEAIAIGKNRSLKQQEPKIDRQKVNGQIKEAWSNALPQLDGSVAYQRSWKQNVMFVNMGGETQQFKMQQANSATGNATLNQPIYTFGRVGSGLKAAYAARRANDHQSANTERLIELEVMKRYWSVLLLRDVVAVRQNGLAVSDSALQKVKRLRDVGMLSDYDVLRAEVQVSNQKPQLQQAQNALRLSELSLFEFLGVPMDTAMSIDGNLAEYGISIPENASMQNVLKRDDLEALRDLTTMSRNVYNIYNNMHWPVIGAQVSYSWQWSDDYWHLKPTNNASSVAGGIAIQIPLWTSGKNSGVAQQHKADWKKMELQLRQAERGARLQYESALRNYQAAVETEAGATIAVQQAEQARTIAQTKLAQGQLTPLEMDAAQLDELVAKVSLAQARFDRLVAAAETRMALGDKPYRTLAK